MDKWLDSERLVHSAKTAIGCIIGLILAKMLGMVQGQWIVITIIVVMCSQLYVGSVLQRAYLRFLGTLIGCLFAIITILTTKDNFLSIIVTISLSSFLFSYLATSNEKFMYAGTLGAVTTAIILLGQTHSVNFALQRLLEICAGIVIASIVSQFILPIHARSHIKRSQAKVLTQLKAYYLACFVTHDIEWAANYYKELDESIIKSLSKQRQLAIEAVREPLGAAYDEKLFMQTLYCEKEILRAIDFMHYTLCKINNIGFFTQELSALTHFNTLILQTFSALIKQIEQMEMHNKAQETLRIPSLTRLTIEFKQRKMHLNEKDIVYADGFLCGAEVLTSCLKKLAAILQIAINEEPDDIL